MSLASCDCYLSSRMESSDLSMDVVESRNCWIYACDAYPLRTSCLHRFTMCGHPMQVLLLLAFNEPENGDVPASDSQSHTSLQRIGVSSRSTALLLRIRRTS